MTNAVDEKGRGSVDAAANAAEEILAHSGRVAVFRKILRKRLELYHRQTEPLVEHYRAQGNLVGIHADRPVNEVFAEIQQGLEQVAVR